MKAKPHVQQIADDVAIYYRGVWGFVDERIRSALVDSAVLRWSQQLDEETLAQQTAQGLAQKLEETGQQVRKLLAAKPYRMPIED